LISESDPDLPVCASTTMHARAAIDFALQEQASIRNGFG
jgi:aspartate/glutamate racemase